MKGNNANIANRWVCAGRKDTGGRYLTCWIHDPVARCSISTAYSAWTERTLIAHNGQVSMRRAHREYLAHFSGEGAMTVAVAVQMPTFLGGTRFFI